jgi:hypothetical protein
LARLELVLSFGWQEPEPEPQKVQQGKLAYRQAPGLQRQLDEIHLGWPDLCLSFDLNSESGS